MYRTMLMFKKIQNKQLQYKAQSNAEEDSLQRLSYTA